MKESSRYAPIDVNLDPSSVRVERRIMTVGRLVRLLEDGRIDLTPAFQRSAELWDKGKQSRLIESILLNLPLPSFYFEYDSYNDRYIVVDGLQRLCALRNFAVTGHLALTGLDFLTSCEGMRWSDMSFYDIRRFGDSEIVCHMIDGRASEDVKFVIFNRLNTGGMPLNAQEIRNSLFPDVSYNVLRRMVESPEFLELGIPTRRMRDMEFALRFIAFFIFDYRYDYFGKMDFFLMKTMEALRRYSSVEINRIIELFSMSILIARDIWGDEAFRPHSSNGYRRPISKAIFESLAVTIARNMDIDFRAKANVFRNEYHDLLDSPLFRRSLATDTSSRDSIMIRFDLTQKLFDAVRYS